MQVLCKGYTVTLTCLFRNGGLDLSCLQTQDVIFDIESFDSAPYMSQLLTLDEQCSIRYLSGATFCVGFSPVQTSVSQFSRQSFSIIRLNISFFFSACLLI